MVKKRSSFIRIPLIATAVILFWRGTWGLMDLYVFPENALLSYIASIVLGLIILFATHKLSDLV